MSVLEELNFIVTKAFKDSGYDIKGDTVRLSDRPDLSQFQSNIALLKAKDFKENPRVIAEKVVDKLKENKVFKIVSVDGPGFINLTLSEDYLANYIENNFEEIDFKKYNRQKRKIIIDYGGPNVAKPLHVGHLRPAIIGESLKRLAKELGNEVIGDVHLGDWGRPMGMIISELKHRKPELVYFDPNYKGEYPKESPVTVEELNEIYPTATKKAKEDEFWDNIEVGEVVDGKVLRFASFGAFVDVRGFDCLAHTSDLSWERISDPSEVLELGKTYEFVVLALDREKNRVSLGYRQLQPQPWDVAMEKFPVGTRVQGKVARIMPFGAFIELDKHIDGLLHVSNVSWDWLEDINSVLKVGDVVEVEVIDFDRANKRITLSRKALLPRPEQNAPAKKDEE